MGLMPQVHSQSPWLGVVRVSVQVYRPYELQKLSLCTLLDDIRISSYVHICHFPVHQSVRDGPHCATVRRLDPCRKGRSLHDQEQNLSDGFRSRTSPRLNTYRGTEIIAGLFCRLETERERTSAWRRVGSHLV